MSRATALADALQNGLAIAEFDAAGEIVSANAAFIKALGYPAATTLAGRHEQFVDPEFARSGAHAAFWRRLVAGEPDEGEYERVGFGGARYRMRAKYVLVRKGSHPLYGGFPAGMLPAGAFEY